MKMNQSQLAGLCSVIFGSDFSSAEVQVMVDCLMSWVSTLL